VKHISILLLFISGFALFSQGQDAKEILQKSEEVLRGNSMIAEMKMTIVRPKWTREMQM